ncbi:flagellar biosynthesis protein FlhF, partial [Pseudomonas aeruginosa]
VELRKTQARIAEARAELTARPAENQRKDRQLFAEEKPARPSLAESMTAAQAVQFETHCLEGLAARLGPVAA